MNLNPRISSILGCGPGISGFINYLFGDCRRDCWAAFYQDLAARGDRALLMVIGSPVGSFVSSTLDNFGNILNLAVGGAKCVSQLLRKRIIRTGWLRNRFDDPQRPLVALEL